MAEYVLDLDGAAVKRFMLAARLADRAERNQWADAGIREGASVADVGCGPGAVTVLLGRQVGPGGTVVGVDRDPAALAVGRQLARTSDAGNVLFSEGDAESTGLAPGTFDVVMLRHVLGHNGGREQNIVDHLRSLLRKGGSLYVVDVEFTGMRIYPPNPSLQDLWHRYLDFQVSLGNDVSVGLRLEDLLRRAGLEPAGFHGRYEIFRERGFRGPPWEAREAMSAAGFAQPDDLVRWREAFDRLDAGEDPPAVLVPFFAVIGRLPG